MGASEMEWARAARGALRPPGRERGCTWGGPRLGFARWTPVGVMGCAVWGEGVRRSGRACRDPRAGTPWGDCGCASGAP